MATNNERRIRELSSEVWRGAGLVRSVDEPHMSAFATAESWSSARDSSAMSNLLLTTMDAVGVQLDTIGDSTGRLKVRG